MEGVFRMDCHELRFTVAAPDPRVLSGHIGSVFNSQKVKSLRWMTLAELSVSHLAEEEIVVVEAGAESLDADRAALMAAAQKHLVLYLAPKEAMAESTAVAKHCTEVMAWPGSLLEFESKLRRLICRANKGHSLESALMLKVNLVGESAVFQKVLSNIGKYSKCDAPVLIAGETGTGKEKIARAIHYMGVSDNQPFVAVNCGAIPDSLVENELFGHVRGAYTDARQAQAGLVEQAEGGTLFLDEIEALSPKGQVALLRFLQDYEYRPLGSQQTRQATLRLITATNEPLDALVAQGCFRKDLYYRINILSLHLPPLRERGDDVVMLAEYFVDKYREVYQQYDKYLDSETLGWMRRHQWPGNVRELESLILREFLLAESACISISPYTGAAGERRQNTFDRRYLHLYRRSFQEAKSEIVGDFERSYLRHVLSESKGNVSEAARRAGKERRTFAKLMDKYGLGRKSFAIE